MEPERLRAFAGRLNRRHFAGKLRAPRIELSLRLRSSAGQADLRRWTIRVSGPYHDRWGWGRELRGTLLHEMIHLWLDQCARPSGHTPEFRGIAARLGCPRWAKRMPARRILHRCPRCRREVLYRKRVRLACRACCDRFHGGRFTGRFLLVPA